MSIIEAPVCKISELQDGIMKECELGPGKVLVVKDGDKLYATGHKCTHYAAPLKSGVYNNGRIRCPWHGACFSASTGDIEDYPGMDGIHTFKVSVQGEDVVVAAPEKSLTNDWKRTPAMTPCQLEKDNRTILIVGGGPAGATCAETLRQEGFQGKVIMVCKEEFLPYDRPKLSKAMNITADRILLRPPEFYSQNNIEVLLKTEVTALDAATKTATLNNGNVVQYDFALVAPGGYPRPIPAPGFDLANIFALRDPHDASSINQLVTENKRVVVVGSSFIGMEVASCIAKKAKSVVVVGMENVPFERVLGERIGASIQKFHEKNNIVFRMRRVVKEFRGVEGAVKAVLLDSGEQLDADVVVVGAGIIPYTSFVKNVEIGRDQSIVCDATLRCADNLYAAGDICRFPYYLTGDLVRIEHWGVAQYQGRIAALNMLGKNVRCEAIPFFWTTQYGKSVRYCGHVLSYDEIIFDGSVEDLTFVGYYIKNNKVVGAVSIGRDPIVAAVAELMHQRVDIPADQVRNGTVDFIKRYTL